MPYAATIAHKYEKIFFAAGVHPYEIDAYDEKILRQYLADEKCVAVGECGLDYFRFKSELVEEIQKENQKKIFILMSNRSCVGQVFYIRTGYNNLVYTIFKGSI